MWILKTSVVEKTQNVDKISTFVDKRVKSASERMTFYAYLL